MGLANQFNSGGGIFRVTHRCHNRAFLLKFALDRDAYREMLRRQLEQFKVCLLDYCLTSNHVHLLLEAEDRLQISALKERGRRICPSLQSAQRAAERGLGR